MKNKYLKFEIIIPLLYLLLIFCDYYTKNFLFLSYGWILLAVCGGIEDAKTSMISDSWSIGIGFGGILHSFLFHHSTESILSFIITFTFYTILYFLFKNGFGLGDVIFSLSLSLWITPIQIILFIWIASLSSLVFVLPKIFIKQNTSKTSIPFAPFLAFGSIVTYFYGIEIFYFIDKMFQIFS